MTLVMEKLSRPLGSSITEAPWSRWASLWSNQASILAPAALRLWRSYRRAWEDSWSAAKALFRVAESEMEERKTPSIFWFLSCMSFKQTEAETIILCDSEKHIRAPAWPRIYEWFLMFKMLDDTKQRAQCDLKPYFLTPVTVPTNSLTLPSYGKPGELQHLKGFKSISPSENNDTDLTWCTTHSLRLKQERDFKGS